MARFRYSLQSILDIQYKLETQARQELATAQVRVNEEEAKLEALKDRLAQCFEEAKRLLTGKLDVTKIEENKALQLALQGYIAAQEENLRIAEEALEMAREHLKSVILERKTYETLREKAFEEFLQEENRAESKVVDELVSYTFGQKKQEN